MLAQRAALTKAPLAQASRPELAQRVSPRELLVKELWLARVPYAQALLARVSQPRVPEHVALLKPGRGLLASLPLVDE